MNFAKSIPEVFGNPVLEFLCAIRVQEVFILLEDCLKELWQLSFDVSRHLVAVVTMAVAHREHVETLLTEHVRCQHVTVLIYLVRIAGLVTARGRKRKLGDRVELLSHRRRSLFLLLRNAGA